MVPNTKHNSYVLLLHLQETLSLDFLEMNFPMIVLVIILWNAMSWERFFFFFFCWVMNKKVIDQLDCMIFPSIVSLKPPGCLEWLNWYSYCFEGIASCTENRKADFVIGNSVLYAWFSWYLHWWFCVIDQWTTNTTKDTDCWWF